MNAQIQKNEAAFGSWPSQISPQCVAKAGSVITAVFSVAGEVYWLESRPQQQGRQTLCTKNAMGEIIELLPDNYSIRSRVHEYGGGALAFIDDNSVLFCNDSDQRVYQFTFGEAPRPVTPEPPTSRSWRYTNFSIHPDKSGAVAVQEVHQGDTVVNRIVWLEFSTQSIITLESDFDFYMSPQISECGTKLAWVGWNHPNMPWDNTELRVANFAKHALSDIKVIDGELEHSIIQPRWDEQGRLLFSSDQSGWWNLYRYDNGMIQALTPVNIEFGFPHWIFGMQCFELVNDNTLIAIGYEKGIQKLYRIDIDDGHIEPIPLPFNCYHYTLQVEQEQLFLLASSSTDAASFISYDLEKKAHKQLHIIEGLTLTASDVSIAEQVEFPTTDGDTAYAFYYEPANKVYQDTTGNKPPAIVMSHGGPSGQADADFNSQIQYWTNRGFAVIDVNYRGSTGYGRDYRNKLRGKWGIYDVADCIAAVEYLSYQGCIDANKVAIRGGSAGGYTTLKALTEEHHPFSAGVSRYGVSDLEALARDCHKFEERYLDLLVGEYPKDKDVYIARSPIHNINHLKKPMLILQGLEDKVVPPNQAQLIVDALADKGLPYAYITFANEAHGFKSAESIIKALDSEWQFYCQVWGIAYEAESILNINNLH